MLLCLPGGEGNFLLGTQNTTRLCLLKVRMNTRAQAGGSGHGKSRYQSREVISTGLLVLLKLQPRPGSWQLWPSPLVKVPFLDLAELSEGFAAREQ